MSTKLHVLFLSSPSIIITIHFFPKRLWKDTLTRMFTQESIGICSGVIMCAITFSSFGKFFYLLNNIFWNCFSCLWKTSWWCKATLLLSSLSILLLLPIKELLLTSQHHAPWNEPGMNTNGGRVLPFKETKQVFQIVGQKHNKLVGWFRTWAI